MGIDLTDDDMNDLVAAKFGALENVMGQVKLKIEAKALRRSRTKSKEQRKFHANIWKARR